MKNELFNELLASVQEMDEIVKGKKAAAKVTEFPKPDARLIREKTGLSQNQFAMLFGVSKRTLENWEQGRRHPTGPAKALLRILDVDPERAVQYKLSSQIDERKDHKNELIKNTDEFIAWTKRLKGRLLVYRGLADADWDVTASAYRRIESSIEITPHPSVFQNYIKQLLDDAKLRGFRDQQGKQYTDLELLAELQHNRAATCLIDFTTNPLIALWFACLEEPTKKGKVVAMVTDDYKTFSTVNYDDLDKAIGDFLYKENKLWKWKPSHLNNRIIAQQSVFVFGKGLIEESYYEVIKITPSEKKKIVEELNERFGINERHLFSDFTGFALSNAHDKTYTDYTPDDYIHLLIEFTQRGDFKNAIDICNRAIMLSPESYIIHCFRGGAECELGNYQEAIADFDKAIELNPKGAEAYHNRGIVKHNLGDYQESITDYDKAISIKPKDAEAYHNRGNAKRKLGDYQESITDYNQATQINPQYAEAYYNRGISKGELGNYQEAISDFDKAIELSPESTDAYNCRGVAKSNLGNYQESIADYNKAIELNPESAEVYHNRGIAKCELGNYQEGIDDFEKAIDINPQYAGAYINRGNVKCKLGDHQRGILDFDKAIELDPQNALAYLNRGYANCGLGNLNDGIADFDKIIEINPQDALAYNKRGTAKLELSNYQEAISDFDKVIEIDAQSVEAYYYRGVTKYALCNFQEAISDFDKVIELNPQSAAAYHYRGVTKHALGNDQEGVTDWNSAAEIDPKFAEFYKSLVAASRNSKDKRNS